MPPMSRVADETLGTKRNCAAIASKRCTVLMLIRILRANLHGTAVDQGQKPKLAILLTKPRCDFLVQNLRLDKREGNDEASNSVYCQNHGRRTRLWNISLSFIPARTGFKVLDNGSRSDLRLPLSDRISNTSFRTPLHEPATSIWAPSTAPSPIHQIVPRICMRKRAKGIVRGALVRYATPRYSTIQDMEQALLDYTSKSTPLICVCAFCFFEESYRQMSN